MSSIPSTPPPPLSSRRLTRPLTISSTPCASCYSRPTLDAVLNNTSPPPYTLSAFMAYLSQNHCLENLEFILDSNRYREAYNDWLQRQSSSSSSSCSSVEKDEENLHQVKRLGYIWNRLLSTYIIPGAPREINLTSQVRDDLLGHLHSDLPSPQLLDSAVKRIYDLIQESIFIPFLNSHSVMSRSHGRGRGRRRVTDDNDAAYSDDDYDYSFQFPFPASFDDTHRHHHHQKRSSRTTSTRGGSNRRRRSPDDKDLFPSISHLGHASFPFTIGGSNNKSSSISRPAVSIPGISARAISPALTDDSSVESSGEPSTPPATPPSSAPAHFGHTGPKFNLPWKKMGKKFGFKRR